MKTISLIALIFLFDPWRPRAHLAEARLATNENELQSHRSEASNPCAGLYPANIAFNLSESFMVNKVNVTKHLSWIVQRDEFGPIEDLVEEQRKIYERFDGFSDINDQSIVAKTSEGICFGVFQPSESCNGPLSIVLDQWQNLNPFTQRIGNTDCVVRSGYVGSYNASYKKEFRRSLDSCVASCDGGCELVLGGYSQGASAAVVASIDLIHYNPEVIQFAPASAVTNGSPCTAVNASRYYRFVNTRTPDGFDIVPNQINIYGVKHIGRLLLLDTTNFPLCYPREDDQRLRWPPSVALHQYDIFLERIDRIINRGCFPVPAAKWPDGHYCWHDDECDSNYCVKETCKRGL